MFRNPFPHKELYRPSEAELEMLDQYQLDLFQCCPRNKYGSLGVPCPSESIMMQLDIKRHQLRNKLEEFNRKNLQLQAEIDQAELAEQARCSRLAFEAHETRKDSAAFSEISKKSDTPRHPHVSFGDPMHGSAIYDTNDEEEYGEEEEEGEYCDEEDDRYDTEADEYDPSPTNHLSVPSSHAYASTSTSTTSTPGLSLTISPTTLTRHNLSRNFMYTSAVKHAFPVIFPKPIGSNWTLPHESPVRHTERRVPRSAPLTRSSKTQYLRDLAMERKDELEDLDRWRNEWRARWYRD